MLRRLWPYLLAGLIALGVVVALVALPKREDDTVWQAGTADVTLGSGAITNPTQAANAPAAAVAADDGNAPAPANNQPFLPRAGDKALTPPDKDLLEDSAPGPVPVTATDGRVAWHYYAKPAAATEARPKLAVILRDLGISGPDTLAAANDLPGDITLAFSPYGDDVLKLMDKARAAGHETLLQLPLEVAPHATMDPGPRSLSNTNSADQNNENLLWNLSRAQGYVGIMTDGGGKLVTNNELLEPLMKNIMGRGLLFIDDTRQAQSSSPLLAEQLQAPWGRTMLQLDAQLTTDAIDVAFGKALALARTDGRVIVVAANTPMMRSALVNWAARLARENVALVPVSAIVTVGAAAAGSAPAAALPNAPPALTPEPEAVDGDEAADGAPPATDNKDDLSSMAPVKASPQPGAVQPGAAQPDGSVNLLATDKKPAAGGSVPTTVVPQPAPQNTVKPNLLDPAKAPVAPAVAEHH